MLFLRRENFQQFTQSYPVVTWLLGINLVLFLAHYTPLWPYIFTYGVGYNPAVAAGEYWRLVTPIFLHSDLLHFLFNSFALFLFGPALETILNKFKFIVLYIVTGIIGNIGTYFFAPPPPEFVFHLGASGAIYGLLGMYVFLVFKRKDLIDPSSSQMVLVMTVIGIVYSFMPNINAYAHFFGLASGFVLAPALLAIGQVHHPLSVRASTTFHPAPGEQVEIGFDPNRWEKRRKRKEVTQKILLGVAVLFVILILMNWLL